MVHLTTEQLEDVLLGGSEAPVHLSECTACAARLAEMQAIRERLRKAFASVQPQPDFAQRLRERVMLARDRAGSSAAARPAPGATGRVMHLLRPWWAAPMAAAALIAVGVGFFLVRPEPVLGARAQLAQIHQQTSMCLCCQTEQADNKACRDSDPRKLCEFIQSQVGYVPILPEMKPDMSLRGACVTRFRDRAVAAYVIQKGDQPITVVVIHDRPESLEMKRRYQRQGREYWACASGGCNLTAVRLGDYTYCVVGEVEHEQLNAILYDLAERAGRE